MRNTFLLLATVLISVGIGAILVYIPMTQREKGLEQQVALNKMTVKNLEEKVVQLQTRQSKTILEEKQKQAESIKAGLAYFEAKVTSLDARRKQVDVYLNGITAVDAVDLVLKYDDTVAIEEVRKGTVFQSYPRLDAENGTVTVTGIAVPQGNGFLYGKTNAIYTTIIVEVKSSPAGLLLDTQNTKAYLNGSPVLDASSNFDRIAL